MRVLFAGTPETAVGPLNALVDAGLDVVGVLTRQDAPLGRKRIMTASPVAQRAEALGLPVVKANRYDDAAHAAVADLAPDVAGVVAYGAILPRRAIDLLPYGWINLHFSVLPQWRGAAPVQRALMAGERELGASTFLIEEGLDTGPVYGTILHKVGDEDTAGTMLDSLSASGGSLLAETLRDIENGRARPAEQTGEPTFASKLSIEDGRIDWNRPAADIEAHVRGTTPEPGAWTLLAGQRVKMQGVYPVDSRASSDSAAPGTARSEGRRVLVACGDGEVLVERIQPAGKKMMNAADWARGAGRIDQETVIFE
ncbi:methionyl-tRNA formyltransferase [Rothia koreensis]|jgi:methionyl-tRNA formyltransferase|uniref:methionyl-tRNA formyltransferase n=1 Tax=Rothia koreensis TaxID=592378 RepID=UPI0037C831C4